MPKYLISANYSTTGLEGVRAAGAKSRVDAVSTMLEAMGGRLESFYFAFGDTDVSSLVVRMLTAPVLLIVIATAAAASSSGTSATANTSVSPNAK